MDEGRGEMVDRMEGVGIPIEDESEAKSSYSEVIGNAEGNGVIGEEVDRNPDYPVAHVAEVDKIPSDSEFEKSRHSDDIEHDICPEIQSNELVSGTR